MEAPVRLETNAMIDLSASNAIVESIVSTMNLVAVVDIERVKTAYRDRCPACPIDDRQLERLIVQSASGQARPVEF